MTDSLLLDAESVVVYSGETVEEGDFVAYPAVYTRRQWPRTYTPSREERNPRDWLEVRRVEGDRIIGVRVNPQDWEAEIEFHVYPVQLHDNGVELVKSRG